MRTHILLVLSKVRQEQQGKKCGELVRDTAYSLLPLSTQSSTIAVCQPWVSLSSIVTILMSFTSSATSSHSSTGRDNLVYRQWHRCSSAASAVAPYGGSGGAAADRPRADCVREATATQRPAEERPQPTHATCAVSTHRVP